MRALILLVAAAWLAALPAFAQHGERGAWGGEGRFNKRRRSAVAAPDAGQAPQGFARERRRAAPAPDAAPAPEGLGRDRRRASPEPRGETPARVLRSGPAASPRQRAAIVRDPAFAGRITTRERVELVPRRYYWHRDGGARYCHYYDGGIHWYGFYHGPAFYWSRLYMGRWWWYDGGYGRWVYWWDGYWWWPGPAGVVYVYMDDVYYPYEPVGVPVAAAEAPAGPFTSPDGKRLVRITGPERGAFLYDKTPEVPVYLKFLGPGAQKVLFRGGKEDKPLNILVEFKDGSFAVFDADGAPVEKAPAPPPSDQPPAPESVPPPPTSAPGQ